jgi:hypothetical protein
MVADPSSPDAQAEVARRHKAAATTVIALFISTVLLSVLAFVARPYLEEKPPNLPLDFGVRITVLMLGLGAIVWRRNKFSAMRLQIAVLAEAIATIGFVTTIITGNQLYTYWSGAIAAVVLVYCYPTKSSWLKTTYRFTDPRFQQSS